MAEENVQPDPWVFGLLTWSPPNTSISVPSQSTSLGFSRCPPVTITARAPISSNFLPAAFMPCKVFHFQAGEKFRFGHVGRDHAGAAEQFIAHEFQPRGIEKFGLTGGGARNRIENHMHEFVSVEKIGDDGGVCAIREHSDLDSRDRDIFDECIELRAQRGAGSCVHGAHALRGLHGERCDRRHAIAIVRRKGFQIGCDARAAGRIESRNGKKNRRSLISVIIQIPVPSARGTNAGDAECESVPAKENVRAFAL